MRFFLCLSNWRSFDWGTKKVENRANEVGFENLEEITRFSFEFWSIELTQLYKTSRAIVNLISQKMALNLLGRVLNLT